MFEKYENKLTTNCGCGTETNVSIESALKQVFSGCLDCGQRVEFTFPNVRPKDKKVN